MSGAQFSVSKFRLFERNLPGVIFWGLGTVVLAWILIYNSSGNILPRNSWLRPLFVAMGLSYVSTLLGMVFSFWWARRAYTVLTAVLFTVVAIDASSASSDAQDVKWAALGLASFLVFLLHLRPMVAVLGFRERSDVSRMPFGVIWSQLLNRAELIHEAEWREVFKDTLAAHGASLREACRDWGMLKASRFSEEIEPLLRPETTQSTATPQPLSESSKDWIWAVCAAVGFLLSVGCVEWFKSRVEQESLATREVTPKAPLSVDWLHELIHTPGALEAIPPERLDRVLGDHGRQALEQRILKSDTPGLWAPAARSQSRLWHGDLKRMRASNPKAGVMWLRDWIKQPLRSQMLLWSELAIREEIGTDQVFFTEEGKAVFGDSKFIGQQWNEYCQFLKGLQASSDSDAKAFLSALPSRAWYVAFRKLTPREAFSTCDVTL